MKNRTWHSILSTLLAALLVADRLAPVCRAQVEDAESLPAIGVDFGEPIPDEPPVEEGNNIWPWIIGVGGVLVVAAVAFIMIEDEKDSSEEDVEEVEAAAAGAAAEAAAEAEAAASEFATFIQIAGKFEGNQLPSGWVADPYIIFQVMSPGQTAGSISEYQVSTGTASLGTYRQVGDMTLLISMNEGYYNGVATVQSETQLRLANGQVLTAVNGAAIRIIDSSLL
jgi:hypothetical protein